MITSLIAGLSILLLTVLTNSYISDCLFVEHPKHEQNKSS